MVVGIEETSSEKPTLKGVAASCTDDVVNENWLIKFVNCQAMLKVGRRLIRNFLYHVNLFFVF